MKNLTFLLFCLLSVTNATGQTTLGELDIKDYPTYGIANYSWSRINLQSNNTHSAKIKTLEEALRANSGLNSQTDLLNAMDELGYEYVDFQQEQEVGSIRGNLIFRKKK
jgi:hypothetical protein